MARSDVEMNRLKRQKCIPKNKMTKLLYQKVV